MPKYFFENKLNFPFFKKVYLRMIMNQSANFSELVLSYNFCSRMELEIGFHSTFNPNPKTERKGNVTSRGGSHIFRHHKLQPVFDDTLKRFSNGFLHYISCLVKPVRKLSRKSRTTK